MSVLPARSVLLAVLLLVGLTGCAGGQTLNSSEPVAASPLDFHFEESCFPGLVDTASFDSVSTFVEEPPELIGGLDGLSERLRYPELARRAGIEGKVCLQFVVNETGNVEDITVTRSPAPSLSEAAIAAVQASQFRPGRQGGEAVNVRFSLPVRFRLEDGRQEPDVKKIIAGTLIVMGAAMVALVVLALTTEPPSP